MKKITFALIIITLFACKKDSKKENQNIIPTAPPPPHVDLIAPCESNMNELDHSYCIKDSIFSNHPQFPNSTFQIGFYNSSAQKILFGFTSEPATGYYKTIDAVSVDFPNRVAIISELVWMTYTSEYTADSVYVENNNDYIIISYCNLPMTFFAGSPFHYFSQKFKKVK
jgi:hypothetical protein